MSESLPLYVLDTSAWLTLIEDESGADTIQQLLEAAQAGEVILLTSFMSYMEVFYITLQERDVDEARERLALMAALPTQRVESSKALGVSAAKLKAHYRLSVADAWIASLANEHKAILVHKDPEYEQVATLIEVKTLPYKGL